MITRINKSHGLRGRRQTQTSLRFLQVGLTQLCEWNEFEPNTPKDALYKMIIYVFYLYLY